MFDAEVTMYDFGINVYSIYMDCYSGVPAHLDRYIADMKTLFRLPNSTASMKSMWLKKVSYCKQENSFIFRHLIMDIGLNYYSVYLDCHGGIPPHLDRYVFDMKNLFKLSNSSASLKSFLLKNF